MPETFKAYQITKDEDGQKLSFTELTENDLMDGDVTVKVEYSALNYKDGLAMTGKAPVVRRFPLIPGIAFFGIILFGMIVGAAQLRHLQAHDVMLPREEVRFLSGEMTRDELIAKGGLYASMIRTKQEIEHAAMRVEPHGDAKVEAPVVLVAVEPVTVVRVAVHDAHLVDG